MVRNITPRLPFSSFWLRLNTMPRREIHKHNKEGQIGHRDAEEVEGMYETSIFLCKIYPPFST